GKLIVATSPAELAKIEQNHRQGQLNGVEDLELVYGNEITAMEPELTCIPAVHSPHTGIIDSHALMLALQGDLEDNGGSIAFATKVERLAPGAGGWDVRFSGAESGELTVDAVINCAGLSAPDLARRTEGYPQERTPRITMAKGNYFGFIGKPAFRRLIYPAPVDGGLGIHVTLDLAGRMRFGPDVQWIENEDYAVDASRAASFYARIRTYWPALPDGSLVPDYAGIRPKITGPGEPAADFMIETPARHGMPGLVHLFGIESPGLTSSLSIAEDVVAAL
ncbi:MAG: FAD-dependent oxidoreductase, partial [Rhizobiales bacterium]|nr:FAD-dependent oxidoreductase [Hyphomicrobiales bacterium]